MIEIYPLILKLTHDCDLSVTILFLEFQSFSREWLRLIYEFDMNMRSVYMVKFFESLSSYEFYICSHA